MTIKRNDIYNFHMRLFKRPHGIYFVEFSRGKRKSLKTKDLDEAKRRFKKLQKNIFGEKLSFLEKSTSLTLSAFFEEYKKWASYNLSFTTCQRLNRILQKFLLVTAPQTPLSSLNVKHMDNFILYCRQRKNTPVTINIEMRHLKAAMSKAVEWKYIKENPFLHIKQLKYQQSPPRFLTTKQIEDVFNIIKNEKYRLAFALYVYTGARRSEIYRLDWRDIKNEGIYIRKSKNYRPRIIPINAKLQHILDEYRKDVGPLFNMSLDQMGRKLKFYLRKAGVGHLKPHDLRHTFASHLVMSGIPLATIKELLGHSSIQTTMIYSHLDRETLQKAVGSLPY